MNTCIHGNSGECADCLTPEVGSASAELAEFLASPPAVFIGDGRHRETDIAVWSDPDEARYNAKMGLDKNSEPMAVDKVLENRLENSSYHATMEEGNELLEMSGDDEFSGLAGSNDPFNETGFNQW